MAEENSKDLVNILLFHIYHHGNLWRTVLSHEKDSRNTKTTTTVVLWRKEAEGKKVVLELWKVKDLLLVFFFCSLYSLLQ